MVLVIEESEDISLDLLSPILDSVKKDNEVGNFISFILIDHDYETETYFIMNFLLLSWFLSL